MALLAKPTNGSNADYAARIGALFDAVNLSVAETLALTYSASMTPDASLAALYVITATNGSAFTINAPTNPITNQRLEIRIVNTSGGALGAATWNAVFKMATWANPATGFSRAIRFYYNGTNWIELGRATADVPN